MDNRFSPPSSDIDLDFLRDLLLQAGKLALGQRGRFVAAAKPDASPVTEVDKQVEAYLIERISARCPGQPILSEESGLHPQLLSSSEFTWVIDPIDGTRSFATGLPIWGISIGVLRRGLPAAGGLYMPVSDEMYWGDCDRAFYNERPMPRLQPPDPASILTFLAVPSNFHLHFNTAYPRLRSLGSTAAHLAYVATGAAAGMVTHSAGLWDIAGLLPVLAAVGAQIAYLSGAPFHPGDMADGSGLRAPLLAAHPAVMEDLRRAVKAA